VTMDRRTFLETNLAAASAFGFLANWGTMAEIRAYKVQGKPLLTENNLNRFFAAANDRGSLSAIVQEANGNLPAFLDRYFSVSPEQKITIAGFTPERSSRVKEALTYAAVNRSIPNFKFVNIPRQTCAEVIGVQVGTTNRSFVTVSSAEQAIRLKLNIPNAVVPR